MSRKNSKSSETSIGTRKSPRNSKENDSKNGQIISNGQVQKTKEVVKKRKMKQKSPRSYKIFIYRVLRQIYSDITIGKKAMDIMDCFMNDIFQRVAVEAGHLARRNKRTTLITRDIAAATKLMLTGDLAVHAAQVGNRAVMKFYKP